MRYQCLIVDDERALADSTAEYFNLFGVSACAVYGAAECRAFFESNAAELLLLDVNLGDGSGFALCKELRARTEVPILFITARTSDEDEIAAFSLGGDDYIRKPYALSVLLAKVKAVLKRCGTASPARYDDGRLAVDFARQEAYVLGSPVRLTAMEFKLLAYLMRNAGRVVGKQELFEKVWEDAFAGDGTLNVHIRRLREAIEEDPASPRYLVTVWGSGYRFEGARP